MRKDQSGIATRVAMLFESVIDKVNEVHKLDLHPVSLKDTLNCLLCVENLFWGRTRKMSGQRSWHRHSWTWFLGLAADTPLPWLVS